MQSGTTVCEAWSCCASFCASAACLAASSYAQLALDHRFFTYTGQILMLICRPTKVSANRQCASAVTSPAKLQLMNFCTSFGICSSCIPRGACAGSTVWRHTHSPFAYSPSGCTFQNYQQHWVLKYNKQDCATRLSLWSSPLLTAAALES